MKISNRLTKELNLVDCRNGVVTTEEIYVFSIEMMSAEPGVAEVPNIWDFSNTEIRGDLTHLDELFETISPRINSHAKVGFVANVLLTAAITKRYSDRFRKHPYLQFETFTELKRCRRWALDASVNGQS